MQPLNTDNMNDNGVNQGSADLIDLVQNPEYEKIKNDRRLMKEWAIHPKTNN